MRSYNDDLEQFIAYLEKTFGEISVQEISSSYVRSWLASLKDRKVSSRSIIRKISTLQSYFKFLLKTGGLTKSPMTNITTPKTTKRLPVFVEQKDLSSCIFRTLSFPITGMALQIT